MGEKSEKKNKKKKMNVDEKASTVLPSKLTSSAMAPMEGHKGGAVQEGDAQQRLKEINVLSQSHKIEVPES